MWKNKQFENLDLNAIFFPLLHLVQNIQGRQLMWSFADKALRSPTGDGALFHRVPPGGTRPV